MEIRIIFIILIFRIGVAILSIGVRRKFFQMRFFENLQNILEENWKMLSFRLFLQKIS